MPLTVDWSFDEGIECPLACGEMLRILEAVLEREHVERPCFVSVTVASDGRIRACNDEWRGIDAPTDVISLECELPDDPSLADGEPCELGDIMIAPGYIRRQAVEFSTTWADEFRIMLVHGMLHLLGYDHLEDDDARSMEARENAILAHIETDAPALTIEFTRHDEDGEAR